MFDEDEWKEVMALVDTAGPSVARTIAEAQAGKHRRVTMLLSEDNRRSGTVETNSAAPWHHRVSLYGPPCAKCSKPLRSPMATFCAECGAMRHADTD